MSKLFDKLYLQLINNGRNFFKPFKNMTKFYNLIQESS